MIKKMLLALLLAASWPAAVSAQTAPQAASPSGMPAGPFALADEDGEGRVPDAAGADTDSGDAALPQPVTAGKAENGTGTGHETAEGADGASGPDGADKPGAGEPDEKRLIGIVTLTSGNLNVRKGPSLEDEIIGKLPNGSVIPVLELYSEWVSIPWGSGIAYVAKPYLRIKEAANTGGRKVVVLDPGHGGKDPGATLKSGIKEADLVWEYTVKAKLALEAAGYVVHLTRDKDRSCVDYKKSEEDLACRVQLAEEVGGDIFISIHADANPVKSFRGTVTFYNARDDYDGNRNPFPRESELLARLVQSHVQPAMGSKDRGVSNRNLYVNRMNKIPSVLVELAVMTNSNDLKLLTNAKRQNAVAQALVKAVDDYFRAVAAGAFEEEPADGANPVL